MAVVTELAPVVTVPQVRATEPRFALANALDETEPVGQLAVPPAITGALAIHTSPTTAIGANHAALLDTELS